MRTIIIQDLNYFDHLSDFCADLINMVLSKTEDHSLLEDCLKTLSTQTFGQGETAAARIVAGFLEEMSVKAPRHVLRLLSYLVPHLDTDSHTLRMAVVQVFGNLVKSMSTSLPDDRDQVNLQSIMDTLEERFRDVNSFVRARVLAVHTDLIKEQALPVSRRNRIVGHACERVMDKSSTVRKRAVQLLGELIRAHPFGVDGGELDGELFRRKLAVIERAIGDMDISDQHAAPRSSLGNATTIFMQQKYYSDAIAFCEQLEKVMPWLASLLQSNVKTEVFEVIDFFVDAVNYKIRGAEEGVRRMVHLIWEKDLTSEDGVKRSVKDHVVDSYKRIYVDADERLSLKEKCLYTANSLVSLISQSTQSELTSIDELMQIFVKRQVIPEIVVQAVFAILQDPHSSPIQKRSSMALLAMLSKADKRIVEKRLDGIVKVGLKSGDDPLLSQYCFQALQSIALVSENEDLVRLPDTMSCLRGPVTIFVYTA